jgi:hypothetical protein
MIQRLSKRPEHWLGRWRIRPSILVIKLPMEPAELDRLITLYETLSADLSEGDTLLKSAGLSEGDPRLVAVANVLLNLDETLTKQ